MIIENIIIISSYFVLTMASDRTIAHFAVSDYLDVIRSNSYNNPCCGGSNTIRPKYKDYHYLVGVLNFMLKTKYGYVRYLPAIKKTLKHSTHSSMYVMFSMVDSKIGNIPTSIVFKSGRKFGIIRSSDPNLELHDINYADLIEEMEPLKVRRVETCRFFDIIL